MDVSAIIPTPSPDEFIQTAEQIASDFSWHKLLYTVLLLLVCLVVKKVLTTLLSRALGRGHIEKSLHTFIRTSVGILLWFLTIVIVLGYVGIPVTSLVAVLSVAGVAVSLAIQGALSNLAGGIMLLTSKPFKVGDYIIAGEESGTVADIGMVYTTLRTIDNRMIFVPNGQMAEAKIINVTHEPKRRVDMRFDISFKNKPEDVIRCLKDVVTAHPKAILDPEPFVRFNAFKESSMEYLVRVWCKAEDYWDLYWDLMEQLKAAMDRDGIEITYKNVNVHIVDKTKAAE